MVQRLVNDMEDIMRRNIYIKPWASWRSICTFTVSRSGYKTIFQFKMLSSWIIIHDNAGIVAGCDISVTDSSLLQLVAERAA